MNQTQVLTVARLRGASIVKLIVLGSTIGCMLISSLFGMAALFGVEAVQWNGQYITGIKGLIASPFIGAFAGILFGLFSAAFTWIGLRIYAIFRGITVEYVAFDNQIESKSDVATG